MLSKHDYRIEDEVTDMPCGFDYESFINGFDCDNPATKVIVEDADFHFAHLCNDHVVVVLGQLHEMGLVNVRV